MDREKRLFETLIWAMFTVSAAIAKIAP